MNSLDTSNELVLSNPFGSCRAYVSAGLTADIYKGLLDADTGLGVRVITDSSAIQEQVEAVRVCWGAARWSLIYLTHPEIDYNSLPDMAVAKDLRTFAVLGPAKIGSVMGTAYGIRAFHKISGDWLGMHSSAIYDNQTGLVHIITGKASSGKSSCAFLLEHRNPQRYAVLGDEWTEVSLVSNRVRQISPVCGLPSHKQAQDAVLANPRYVYAFSSFGKKWYSIRRASSSERDNYQLGGVFQLDAREKTDNSVYILRKINSHIPFMNTDLAQIPVLGLDVKEARRIRASVVGRVTRILNGYQGLAERANYHILDANDGDMMRVAIIIQGLIESQK